MNEKMNRHEAEPNEVALEGVSGGGSYNMANHIAANVRAQNVCFSCHFSLSADRSAHIEKLTNYLLENGLDRVNSYQQCPYYK